VVSQLADVANVGLLRMMTHFRDQFSVPTNYVSEPEAVEAAKAYYAQHRIKVTVVGNVVFSPTGYWITPNVAWTQIVQRLPLDKLEHLQTMRGSVSAASWKYFTEHSGDPEIIEMWSRIARGDTDAARRGRPEAEDRSQP